MAHDLTPCLWFATEALEAARFYAGIFPHGHLLDQLDGAPDTPPIWVSFEIDGTRFLALNGNPEPGFTNAVSFLLNCDSQQEIDHLWDALSNGGQTLACGWLIDRFGVRWQVVPRKALAWLSTGSPAQRQQAMAAMQTMVKFDMAAMEAAHRGGEPA